MRSAGGAQRPKILLNNGKLIPCENNSFYSTAHAYTSSWKNRQEKPCAVPINERMDSNCSNCWAGAVQQIHPDPAQHWRKPRMLLIENNITTAVGNQALRLLKICSKTVPNQTRLNRKLSVSCSKLLKARGEFGTTDYRKSLLKGKIQLTELCRRGVILRSTLYGLFFGNF